MHAEKIKVPGEAPAELVSVIETCRADTPEDRPYIEEIYQSLEKIPEWHTPPAPELILLYGIAMSDRSSHLYLRIWELCSEQELERKLVCIKTIRVMLPSCSSNVSKLIVCPNKAK